MIRKTNRCLRQPRTTLKDWRPLPPLKWMHNSCVSACRFCFLCIVQVVSEAESAEGAFSEAKEAAMGGRTELSRRQTDLAALQADAREKSKKEGLALAKIKEVRVCACVVRPIYSGRQSTPFCK